MGVRDADFMGHVIGPTGAVLREVYAIWAKMVQLNGGNPYLGRNLRQLLHEAGFREVVATATYETHGSPQTLELWRGPHLTPEGALGKGFLAHGLVDREQLERLYTESLAWAEQPGAFLARPWCEAVGWKP